MHNVGLLERVIRVILGLIAIIIALNPTSFSLPDWGAAVLIVVGAGLVITGLIAYCPIFALLNINTCEECKYEEESAQSSAMTYTIGKVAKKPARKKAAAKKATTKRKSAKKTTRKKPAKRKTAKKTAKKTTRKK